MCILLQSILMNHICQYKTWVYSRSDFDLCNNIWFVLPKPAYSNGPGIHACLQTNKWVWLHACWQTISWHGLRRNRTKLWHLLHLYIVHVIQSRIICRAGQTQTKHDPWWPEPVSTLDLYVYVCVCVHAVCQPHMHVHVCVCVCACVCAYMHALVHV